MKRRDFLKTSAVSAMGVPTVSSAGLLPMPGPLIMPPTPKTADELYVAINRVFRVGGHSTRSYEVVGDGQTIRMVTYISAALVEDNDPTTLFCGVDVVDQYFKTEQEAVAALWKQVLSIRQGKQKLPPEAVEDGIKPVPSSIIYWRSKPESRVTRNGLVSVRMRAAFL